MNQITLKIPKNKQKVKIIKSSEIIHSELIRKLAELEDKHKKSLLELALIKEHTIEETSEIDIIEDVQKPKRTIYTEVFTISDSNQPIEITLSNIPEQSVSIDDAVEHIQKAYDQGFTDGQQSARVIFESEIALHAEWIKRFDSIAFALKKEFLKEQRKFEDSLIELSCIIAEKILEDKIERDKHFIINQIRRAFEELNNDEIYKIILSNDDFEVLSQVESDLIKDIIENDQVVITKSSKLEKGSCTLDTSAGIIDARIANQLSRLKDSLLITSDERREERERTISDEYPAILDSIIPKELKDEILDIDDELIVNSYQIDNNINDNQNEPDAPVTE